MSQTTTTTTSASKPYFPQPDNSNDEPPPPKASGASLPRSTSSIINGTMSAAIRAVDATFEDDPLHHHALRILLYDARLTCLSSRAANDHAIRAMLPFLDASATYDMVTKVEDDRSRDSYATPTSPPEQPSLTMRAFRAATRAAKVERRVTTYLSHLRDSIHTTRTTPLNPSASAAVRALLDASNTHRAFHLAAVNRALDTWPRPPPIRQDVQFSVNAHVDALRNRTRQIQLDQNVDPVEHLRARPMARARSKSILRQPYRDPSEDAGGLGGYAGSPPRIARTPSGSTTQMPRNSTANMSMDSHQTQNDPWAHNHRHVAQDYVPHGRMDGHEGVDYNLGDIDDDNIDDEGLYEDERNERFNPMATNPHLYSSEPQLNGRQGRRMQQQQQQRNRRGGHPNAGFTTSNPDVSHFPQPSVDGRSTHSASYGGGSDVDMDQNPFDPPPAPAPGFSQAQRRDSERDTDGHSGKSPQGTSSRYSGANPNPYAAPWPPSPHYYYLPPYGHPYGHFPPMYDATPLHFPVTERLLRDTPSRVAGFRPGVEPGYESLQREEGYDSAPESLQRKDLDYDFSNSRGRYGGSRSYHYGRGGRGHSKRNGGGSSHGGHRRDKQQRGYDDYDDYVDERDSDPGSVSTRSGKRTMQEKVANKSKRAFSQLADLAQNESVRKLAGTVLEQGRGLPKNVQMLQSMHKTYSALAGKDDPPSKRELIGQVGNMVFNRGSGGGGRRDSEASARGGGRRKHRGRAESSDGGGDVGGLADIVTQGVELLTGGKKARNSEAFSTMAQTAMGMISSQNKKGNDDDDDSDSDDDNDRRRRLKGRRLSRSRSRSLLRRSRSRLALNRRKDNDDDDTSYEESTNSRPAAKSRNGGGDGGSAARKPSKGKNKNESHGKSRGGNGNGGGRTSTK